MDMDSSRELFKKRPSWILDSRPSTTCQSQLGRNIKKSVREEATLTDTRLHEVEAPVDDSGLEPPTKN